MPPFALQPVTAYLDCFSGISGDMFLGALLQAGLPLELLTETLSCLDLPESYQLLCQSTTRHASLQAMQFEVRLADPSPVRDWQAIQQMLQDSRLPQAIRARALAIFEVLAVAEAKVHGCPVAQVHFHELGAVDSIIDIVGAAIGLDYFQVDQLVSAPLPWSRGWVRSGHGLLPLPAPAVCELLQGIPVCGVDLEMELVTPTGAALVKACATGFGPLPPMAIRHVGYGAGTKTRPDGQPNLLRLLIGEGSPESEAQRVTIIETNLDDWSPETFPFLSEQLLAQGALDVTLIPVQMKKGRPGFILQVMAPPALAFSLQQRILAETSAIGLRFRQENRRTLPRRLGWVKTAYGEVKVKWIDGPSGSRLTPEYEDCRRVALTLGVSLAEIYRAVAVRSAEDFCEETPSR